jgi:queuine tRNA-ribosyltransferase
MIRFTIEQKDSGSSARRGILELHHGTVSTPAFMPVGTNGTVKALHHDLIDEIGYEIILANTYHLYLRPGIDIIRKAGGLHSFASWNTNILTDSGGYQIFSLADRRKIKEDGVSFTSHIDGSSHFLTPEGVIDLQCGFGSDILMPLDVCTEPDIEYRFAASALRLTTDWAKKSYRRWNEYQGKKGALFGIIQGNFHKDLRRQSCYEISSIGFPGLAIGGLSVGEEKAVFLDFLGYTAELLPKEIPHYVMGIGTPDYILHAIEQGIDIFDCVLATRIARNGTVFTDSGTISLKKEQYTDDFGPILEGCGCRTCRKFSRAYLRHLFKTREILGPMLTTEHNLYFLQNMMRDVRLAIQEGRFTRYKETFLRKYHGTNRQQ